MRNMLDYSSQKPLEREEGCRAELRLGQIYQGTRSSMKAKSDLVDYLGDHHAIHLDCKSVIFLWMFRDRCFRY